MSSSVRAKFRLDEIISSMHKDGHWEDSKWIDGGKVEKRTLVFRPVYSDNPESENHTFWEATPSGEIRLGVVNQEAWQYFELDKEYYIDFTLASRNE